MKPETEGLLAGTFLLIGLGFGFFFGHSAGYMDGDKDSREIGFKHMCSLTCHEHGKVLGLDQPHDLCICEDKSMFMFNPLGCMSKVR